MISSENAQGGTLSKRVTGAVYSPKGRNSSAFFYVALIADFYYSTMNIINGESSCLNSKIIKKYLSSCFARYS